MVHLSETRASPRAGQDLIVTVKQSDPARRWLQSGEERHLPSLYRRQITDTIGYQESEKFERLAGTCGHHRGDIVDCLH